MEHSFSSYLNESFLNTHTTHNSERMALLQSATGSYGSDGWEKAKIASSSSDMDYGTTSMTVPTTDGRMDGRMDGSMDASMQQQQQRRYHSASDDVISFASAPKSIETNERRAKEERDRQACCGGSCSFCRALGIPGVLEFAMSLFFAKFVAYMFIYWLPYYLGHLKFSTDEAANISSYFDLGGKKNIFFFLRRFFFFVFALFICFFDFYSF